MIDLHAHCLPDIDDGPATLEQAVALVSVAVEEGIRSMVATPHFLIGHYEPDPATIAAGLALLRRAAADRGLPIRFLPGAEIHLVEDLLSRLRRGEMLTLNGTRYLLLELPFVEFPLATRQVIFDLALAGYHPILAHAERYRPIQQDPGLLYQWAQSGVLAQVTSGSLLGHHGEAARQCARVLLEHGLAQFLATDAHDARLRAPRMRQALEIASHWLGREGARALVEANPARVLVGEPVAIDAREPSAGRRWSLAQWWPRRRAGG